MHLPFDMMIGEISVECPVLDDSSASVRQSRLVVRLGQWLMVCSERSGSQ